MPERTELPLRDYEWPAGPPHRFAPWRDEYGRLHEDVPRCCGYTRPRNAWSSRVGECHRKGVVQRGAFDPVVWHGERWYCLQHDPARRDEKRVAEAAPTMRGLLAEAIELMPQTKRSAAWHERAQALLDRTEPKH
jgi:hypothetical protein